MARLRAESPDEHDLRFDWPFDGEEFEEEEKIRNETRKILELPDLPVQAICVRVPVLVGHLEAVWVETEAPRRSWRPRPASASPSVRPRGRRPVSTTSSSAASVATRRWSTASRSSSRATTSARAPRSTGSRSRSSSSSGSPPPPSRRLPHVYGVARAGQQVMDLRPAARLGSVRDVELAIDVREVELDRLLGHPEHLGELRVRMALGD